MRKQVIVIGAIFIIALAIIAILVIPPMLNSQDSSSKSSSPPQGWHTDTPESQGFDSVKLADSLLEIKKSNTPIDSLLIVRNGKLVLDAYFFPYDGSIVHDLASVTKSFMTTLIGIAADQGTIQLDQPMVSYFPERTIANLDERKQQITVRHLTGNVNGLESGCFVGDESTLNSMRKTSDWVQHALSRAMKKEPGKSFCYDSPGMHILSAILHETTGMTALDFARQNLFEPLGIHEVAWESDPQGYTHGWGDLHLKPVDAAKLGYLWLNKGIWNGKQIVSAKWVEESVKAQHKGDIDGYGYGWWVSDDTYYAMGRGGQYVQVIPGYNTVIVMTAHGTDFDVIIPYIIAAFLDPEKPLPENPEGVARLNEALTAIQQPPPGSKQALSAQPSSSLPEMAKIISGKTYFLDANHLGLETLSLEFDDTNEAIMRLKTNASDEIVTMPIGLDGKFRQSPDGLGLRGAWIDPQTFFFEIFDKGEQVFQVNFEGDRMTMTGNEFSGSIQGETVKP